ncbi:TM0106 family RecB-like putative nuclease [Pseudonocardia acaciae]|uniref:TM0106 family RecB-like putative nuclease n=1 Tax=Pseudonocardia acaciae TaxID=551276 RepID=UPI00048E72DD|nr:TM0106 family RecB-like putative nuclease [Pseudonocardia acaciae]
MAVIAGRVALDASSVVRCRRRVHLDHDPSAAHGPRAEPDPALEQRRADATAHRAEIGARLAALAGADWVATPDGSVHERERATSAALASGARYVWNAVLPVDGARTGEADLLVRAEDGGYRPVIVVRHRVTDPGAGALTGPFGLPKVELAAPDPARRPRSQSRDQLRLAHLTRMLESIGHATAGPALGGVIGLDADVVLWHDLSAPTWPGGHDTLQEYDARFADRVAVATAAAAGEPALAEPSRITECRRCPWWPTCEAVLADRRDVSLVLRGEDAMALRAAGVGTVAQLAALDPAGEPPVPLGGMPFADAVVLARAFQRGLPLVRRVAEVKVPRADVELDVDMESFSESGAYMWGCLLSTPSGVDLGVPVGYRAFATWEPLPTADEARSFAEFWGWLRELRARCAELGLSFAAYCYNEQAENRWLLASADRFAGHPGIPSRAEVIEFITSDAWIDLFAVVSEWFLCAHGKGLKRIAPAAGFTWHDPDASGENSMRWYRAAVGMDGEPPDPGQRDRLLRYNSDDVHATLTLREWMCSPGLADIPLAAEL